MSRELGTVVGELKKVQEDLAKTVDGLVGRGEVERLEGVVGDLENLVLWIAEPWLYESEKAEER